MLAVLAQLSSQSSEAQIIDCKAAKAILDAWWNLLPTGVDCLTEEKTDIFSKHKRPSIPEKWLCQEEQGHIDSQKVEI